MAERLRELVSTDNRIVYPSATAVIKQASAGSVFLNPTSLEAFSNANGSYDSTTLGMRTILAFQGGIAANSLHQLVLGYGQHPLQGLTSMTLASVITGAGSAVQLQARIRMRTITTAAFDINTVTWNSFANSPPSFGTTVEMGFPYNLTMAGNLTVSATDRVGVFAFATDATLYAIAVDVYFSVATTGGGTIVSFSNAFTTPRTFPFLIKGA